MFEVASIRKVVTAYTALCLVERGELSLDDPLNAYLTEPWLPPSDYADSITLRHLASHSSGLSDGVIPPVDKSIAFEPGSDFLYSGVGALYIQEAIEQVTGKSLEDAAHEAVFEPLGMSSSTFANEADVLPRMANGHMGYILPLLAFVVPFGVILIGIGLIGMVVLRIRTGQWRLTRKMVVGVCVAATILTLLILAFFFGKALPNFMSLIVLCVAGFAIAYTMMFLTGRRIAARLPVTWRNTKRQRALAIAWIALSGVALL